MKGRIRVKKNERESCIIFLANNLRRWSRGLNVRGQGLKQNPRPSTDFLSTAALEAKDINGQGRGQRTQFFLIETTDSRVACSFAFTQPFSC